MNLICKILFLTIFLFITAPTRAATNKVALVIGNSNYRSISKLTNPVNDAIDVSEKLKKLGFIVRELKDAQYQEMVEAISWFKHQSKDVDLKIFYYAGHATQLFGENYLIPLNAKITNQKSLSSKAISLHRVLPTSLNKKNPISIVILDSCRNNPFDNVSDQHNRSAQYDISLRSLSRGLAPVKTNSEVYIAFATGPGNVAADGSGRNGTYTSSLLRFIDYPGITIEEMFKLVRTSVLKETFNKQIPWEHSSLTSPVYLNNPVQRLIQSITNAMQQNNYGLAYRNLKKAKSTTFNQTDSEILKKLESKLKKELGVY